MRCYTAFRRPNGTGSGMEKDLNTTTELAALNQGRRHVLAPPEHLDRLVHADLDSLPAAGEGRGAVRRLELPDGRALLIRRYRHGGLFRAITGGRFFTARRPLAELRVTIEAAGRSVPVPRAVGVISEFRGLLLAVYLVTEEIDGAIDLGAYLRSLPAAPTREIAVERREVADALGKAVRTMHDAGLHHADLQVKNILLRRTTTGVEVFFIDLDKSSLRAGPLPGRLRARNLMRLNRSALKMRLVPPPVDDDDRRRFLAAYRAGGSTLGDVPALLRRCRRHAAWHAVGWRLFRGS